MRKPDVKLEMNIMTVEYRKLSELTSSFPSLSPSLPFLPQMLIKHLCARSGLGAEGKAVGKREKIPALLGLTFQ